MRDIRSKHFYISLVAFLAIPVVQFVLAFVTTPFDSARQDADGNTALHRAVINDDLPTMQTLFSMGVFHPNIQNAKGRSPLLEAVIRHSSLPVLELLLDDTTVQVNLQAEYEGVISPALHIAAQLGNLDHVNALLRRKDVLINAVNGDGMSVFCMVVDKAQDSIKRPLFLRFFDLEKLDVNQICSKGTALHIALANADMKTFDDIIADSRVDPDIKNADGNSPLFQSLYSGMPRLFASLLNSKRFKVDAKDENDNTILHVAVNLNSVSCTKTLLEMEPAIDRNSLNKDKLTPLFTAIKNNSPLVNMLLNDTAVDVNKDCTIDGISYLPLHFSIMQGNVPLFKTLLDHPRLNLDLRNGDMTILCSIASQPVSTESLEMFSLLKPKVEKVNTMCGNLPALGHALRVASDRISDLDIGRGSNTTEEERDSIAAEHKVLELSNELLELEDISVNVRSSGGDSPLSLVVCGSFYFGEFWKKVVDKNKESSPKRAKDQLIKEWFKEQPKSKEMQDMKTHYFLSLALLDEPI